MGEVVAIVTAPAAAAPCETHPSRAATARGLEGDRYTLEQGTFSDGTASGRALTLIAQEALDALHAETGIRLQPAEARRNLVTRGVDLDALLGTEFLVGEVRCRAVRDAPPCAHLQRITRPGVLAGLVGRGGIRADVLVEGVIHVGDPVRPLG